MKFRVYGALGRLVVLGLLHARITRVFLRLMRQLDRVGASTLRTYDDGAPAMELSRGHEL
jgi:hypothetical protein